MLTLSCFGLLGLLRSGLPSSPTILFITRGRKEPSRPCSEVSTLSEDTQQVKSDASLANCAKLLALPSLL